MTIKKKRCAYVYSVQYKYVYVRIQAIHEEKTSYFAYWPWTPPPIPSAGFASSGAGGGLAILPHYPGSPPSYRASLQVQGGMVFPSHHPGPPLWRLCQLGDSGWSGDSATLSQPPHLIERSSLASRSRVVWCFYHTILDPLYRAFLPLGGPGRSGASITPPWTPIASGGYASLGVRGGLAEIPDHLGPPPYRVVLPTWRSRLVWRFCYTILDSLSPWVVLPYHLGQFCQNRSVGALAVHPPSHAGNLWAKIGRLRRSRE